uniref:Autophagy-related protein 9 n=1 Tax=Glossina morsitans morsitans TaxID=37546 RepID=A0ABK9N763_GLOMM
MSATQINYRSLNEENTTVINIHELETSYEVEDTPRNSGVLVHTVPEKNKTRWNHIQDLDSFFTKMYQYHQKHGFSVILVDEIFQLFVFTFVIWLLVFTANCLNHDMLFGNVPPPNNHSRVAINDVIYPVDKCLESFGSMTYLILIISALYFFIRTVKFFYNITQYWDIKKFYNTALNIGDSDLDNITWYEVKKKVREVQAEQNMCIDKDHLTDLDIYHRILRFKNYMVALMNKNLLPARFNIPLFGEVVGLSRGLLFNIDLILFRSPGSPFQNNWQLRDDYNIRGNQVDLAKRLSKLILWVALANLIFSPLIFIWQIIYFSFTYANILKKEPGALGMRTWSNYGRLYLRHFNELDHELDARLNRAYEYADKYLSSFSSPLLAVFARNILFISGGLLVVVLALGIYNEFVFQIEHVVTLITVLSAIGLICRSLIPDDNLIWCPEQLMTAILAHVHYLPSSWKNKSHTTLVQKEFGYFFQFKANYVLYEIFSPLITPFLLLFVFRPKALEIVKFFRSFTVFVRGVGNVCSFAQMDVRKYGNPEWQLDNSVFNNNADDNNENQISCCPNNGKIELSLLRFTLTNPDWQMPSEAINFVNGIRENAIAELSKAKTKDFRLNALTESLISFGTMGDEYSSVARSLLERCNIRENNECFNEKVYDINHAQRQDHFEQMLQQNLGEKSQCNERMRSKSVKALNSSFGRNDMKKLRTSKLEGRLEGPSQSLLHSLYGPESLWEHSPSDLTIADMCLSTLYLHEIHNRKQKSEQPINAATIESTNKPSETVLTSNVGETTPLLTGT